MFIDKAREEFTDNILIFYDYFYITRFVFIYMSVILTSILPSGPSLSKVVFITWVIRLPYVNPLFPSIFYFLCSYNLKSCSRNAYVFHLHSFVLTCYYILGSSHERFCQHRYRCNIDVLLVRLWHIQGQPHFAPIPVQSLALALECSDLMSSSSRFHSPLAIHLLSELALCYPVRHYSKICRQVIEYVSNVIWNYTAWIYISD